MISDLGMTHVRTGEIPVWYTLLADGLAHLCSAFRLARPSFYSISLSVELCISIPLHHELRA